MTEQKTAGLADMLLPTYRQMLGALSNWLEKAEQQCGTDDTDAMMAARLAPDMFPLATQVRFCCVQAIEGTSRLARETLPPTVETMLDEGRNAGEQPGTVAEAKAHIAETLSWLGSHDERAMPVGPGETIEHALPNGMIFDFTAEQYVRDWAVPQFNFHLMTAYAIMRSKGVELGKVDYVAHLLPLVRPGTMPR